MRVVNSGGAWRVFFSFLKSFRFFFLSGFSSLVCMIRRAPLPLSVPGVVPVTSSYSSIGSMAKPMMSCLAGSLSLGR